MITNLNFVVFRYIKKLQEAVRGKTKEELNTDENKIIVTALVTTSNISTLIRDLFHTPPSFKSTIHLSWLARKPTTATDTVTPNKVCFLLRSLFLVNCAYNIVFIV